MEYKLHNGSGGLCCKGCSRQDKKLNTYDWLADIPGNGGSAIQKYPEGIFSKQQQD